jgi:hypothetical protein
MEPPWADFAFAVDVSHVYERKREALAVCWLLGASVQEIGSIVGDRSSFPLHADCLTPEGRSSRNACARFLGNDIS